MVEEKCGNPWKCGEACTSTDILLYITIEQGRGKNKGKVQVPICKQCWVKIADSNKEWGDSTHDEVPKPILVKGELPKELESQFQPQDTMNIGKMKKRREDKPEEEEEY